MVRKRAEGECSRCGEWLEFTEEWGKEPSDGDYTMELMEIEGADYVDGELVCTDCAEMKQCDECGEYSHDLTSVNNWGELCENCNPRSEKNLEKKQEEAELKADHMYEQAKNRKRGVE